MLARFSDAVTTIPREALEEAAGGRMGAIDAFEAGARGGVGADDVSNT